MLSTFQFISNFLGMFKEALTTVQGAEVVLAPPLLYSYEVEGAPILFSHPVHVGV